MKTTRSQFLATVATGLAAAALSPGRLLAATDETPDGNAFRGLVGETFRFRGPDGREGVDLVLAACADAPAHYGRSQFTLTLAAPGGESLKEGLYAVENPKTGPFDMFIVPTGRDAKGQSLFRADFNLSLPVVNHPTTVVRRR
jgi:hypothetical protein